MFVGTFKETVDGESRVAISPESCKKLSNLGYTILIEKDAGVNSSFSNLSYESAGAKLIDNKFDIINQVDILLSVTSIPDEKIIEKSKQNLIIVGTFDTYEKRTGKKHQILISYKPFLFAEPSNKKKH